MDTVPATDLRRNEEQFLESEWFDQAKRPETENRVRADYQRWVSRVSNSELVSRAGKLWKLLTSGDVGGKEKVAVIAGLLYLISPIDLVPDYIPVVGWLDDLGVAAFVLAYVLKKADELEDREVNLEDAAQPAIEMDTSALREAGIIDSVRDEVRYIQDLKRVCSLLNAETLLPTAGEIENRCHQQLFRVMFIGRYNTGKSTLINRLLGSDYLVPGAVPTTKAVTFILPGLAPQLFTEGSDGRINLHGDVADLKDEQNLAVRDANRISLLVPSEALRPGICLIDTPGLEDPDFDTTALIGEYVAESDALVFVLDSSYPIDERERQFIEKLLTEDRHRKLFFVANKIDKIKPDELRTALDAIREELEALDVTPRIFPLVGDAERDQGNTCGFDVFRESLSKFLGEGRATEQKRIIRHGILGLAQQLYDVSLSQQELAKETEAERQRTMDELRQQEASAVETMQRTQEELSRRIELLESGLIADLEEFSRDLESTVCRRIDEASLDDLRKTDLLERTIRDETKSFLEPRLTQTREQLGEMTDGAVRQMMDQLKRLEFSIDVSRSRSMLEESPEIVTAGILVVSFPFLSLFSFIYVLIGVMLGKNVLEGMVKGLMGRVALTKLRAELKTSVSKQLHEYKARLSERLHQQFLEIKTVTMSHVASAADQLLGPVKTVLETTPTDTSSAVSSERISQATEVLDSILRESRAHREGAGHV